MTCEMRSALPRVPFPGLLCDGPPRARLRSGEPAFFCHRQRQSSRPPSSFRLAEKKTVRARARRKGRQRAEPVYRDRAGHRDRRTWYRSGYNRGIDWQNQFRAEPLRLALPWEQAAARATASLSAEHDAGSHSICIRQEKSRISAGTGSDAHRYRRVGALFSLGGESAAAGGRKRRALRSAAASLAGRRKAGPGRALAARRKNRFSFRARSKREMGLDLRRNRLTNSFPHSPPLASLRSAASPCRGGRFRGLSLS